MFAIIKSGGKQYKVEKNSMLEVEKLSGNPGALVEFKEVLLIGEQNRPIIVGRPLVEGASVTAEILKQARSSKIIIFKKKRRQNYRRKNGHRQHMTHLLIKDIKKI
ncbi:50S ribosomal protein L21 [Rickettsiales bacterium Ac37b]|nr:50S ribosomal protein L21 [Rickettsiales bacterium Ac37b]